VARAQWSAKRDFVVKSTGSRILPHHFRDRAETSAREKILAAEKPGQVEKTPSVEKPSPNRSGRANLPKQKFTLKFKGAAPIRDVASARKLLVAGPALNWPAVRARITMKFRSHQCATFQFWSARKR